jgi:hypothetical protein
VQDLATEVEKLRRAQQQTDEDVQEIKTGSHNIPPPGTLPLPQPLPPPPPAPRLTSSPPWLRAVDKKWRQITIGGLVSAAGLVITVLLTSAVKDCQAAVARTHMPAPPKSPCP